MRQLALKYEKEKGSHSVVKDTREFAREIDLDLENEFDGEMKNTENDRKLKELLSKKDRRLSILPRGQNLCMVVSTPFEAKKLNQIYMTPIRG